MTLTYTLATVTHRHGPALITRTRKKESAKGRGVKGKRKTADRENEGKEGSDKDARLPLALSRICVALSLGLAASVHGAIHHTPPHRPHYHHQPHTHMHIR